MNNTTVKKNDGIINNCKIIEYCLCINGIATDIYNKPLYKFPDYNSAFQYGMYCKGMGYLVSIFKINNGFIDPFCTNL